MSDAAVPTTPRPRRTFMGVILAGAGALLALPSLVGRRAMSAVRKNAGAETRVRPHPAAIPRSHRKAQSHG